SPSTILKNKNNVFSPQMNSLGMFAEDNTNKAEGGIFLDFNNDGRIDIFVVKDGSPNQLFKNTGIFQFVNVAGSAGVATAGPGRSAVAADFNNDGFQDLYVVYFNKPNKLFLNNKNETFRDASKASGVNFSGGSVQAAVTDFDGDGDLDLFVVNNKGTSA